MQAQILTALPPAFLGKWMVSTFIHGGFLTMWPSSPQGIATSETTLGMKSTWKGFHHFRSLQACLAAAGRRHQHLLAHLCLSELTSFFIMLRSWSRMETEQRCSLSTKSWIIASSQGNCVDQCATHICSFPFQTTEQSGTLLRSMSFIRSDWCPSHCQRPAKDPLWTRLSDIVAAFLQPFVDRETWRICSFFLVQRSIWTYSTISLSVQGETST